MGASSENHELLGIVRDPILRIDKTGVVKAVHLHEESDPAFVDLDLLNKNIRDFEFMRDMKDDVAHCLESREPMTSYFSWAYGGQLKHYEALLEPQSDEELLALIKEVTKKKQRDNELLEYSDLIQNIFEGISTYTGYDFLDNLATHLAKSLKSDCTAIFVIDKDKDILKTMSLWEDGSIIKNIKGPIKGSPFEHIDAQGLLEIRSGFKDLYPDFFLLDSVQANSFVGVPMYYNQSNEPMGMMATLYHEPIKSVRQIDKVLKIFSARAATELERMENMRQLAASEQKFKALYNNTPALFNSVNKEGFLIEVGDFFLEKTGYLREEVIGKHAFEFVTKESQEYGMQEVFPSFKELGYCKDVPMQFVKKNGKILDVLMSATLVRDAKGEVEKIVANLNDVTELRRIERDIKHREARVVEAANRYQSFFDNSPVGIIIHTDGIIKHVNREAVRLAHGRSVIDMIGKEALSFVHPDSQMAAKARIASIYRTKSAHRNEQKFQCLDGDVIEVEAMGTLIEYEGKPSIQIAIYDISERKEAQRKLLERDKKLKNLNEHLGKQKAQLEEFAHIASHNLRAPVNNMMSLIKIRDSDPTPENDAFVWESIGKTVANLDETLIELNDVVKTSWELDKNKLELRFVDIMEKILASIGNQVDRLGADINLDFKLDSIYYPKVYLESIMQNLVTNALKYSDKERKPEVKVKSWEENGKAMMQVQDNGVGIDMEKFGKKLFGLRKTFHNNEDARGVGLFITKAQIESMGGSISVDSEVGKGSIFTVNFGDL